MAWHSMVWHGMAWYGAVRYGMIWYHGDRIPKRSPQCIQGHRVRCRQYFSWVYCAIYPLLYNITLSLLYMIVHYYALSYHTYRIVPYRTVPYRIVPYRIVPYRIVSYRIVSYRIVSYRIVSYRIVSYRIISYRIVSDCVVSCPVMCPTHGIALDCIVLQYPLEARWCGTAQKSQQSCLDWIGKLGSGNTSS